MLAAETGGVPRVPAETAAPSALLICTGRSSSWRVELSSRGSGRQSCVRAGHALCPRRCDGHCVCLRCDRHLRCTPTGSRHGRCCAESNRSGCCYCTKTACRPPSGPMLHTYSTQPIAVSITTMRTDATLRVVSGAQSISPSPNSQGVRCGRRIPELCKRR